MANKTYVAFVDKQGGTPATSYIGNEGELFYDPTTTTLRVSDGSTPGGTVVSAGGGANTGDITFVDSSIRTQANLEIRTNGVDSPSVWNFDITGDLTIPGSIVSSNSFTVISEVGGTSSGVFLDGANNAILFATSNAIIRSDNDGTFKDLTFFADGNLEAPGTISAPNINATNNFSLPVYATDAARDTAISSPQPGMMVYVSSGEGAGLQVRGATQWNPVGGLTGV